MAMDGTGHAEAAEEEAWAAVYSAIDRAFEPGSSLEIPTAQLQAVKEAGLGTLVAEYLGDGLDENLRTEVVPTFWTYFNARRHDQPKAAWVCGAVREGVGYVAEAMQRRAHLMHGLGQALGLQAWEVERDVRALRGRCAALVFNTAPPQFQEWMALYLRLTLRSWHQRWRAQQSNRADESGDGEGMAIDDEEEEEEDEDEEEVWEVGEAEMLQTWQGLRELQWVPLLQATITQLLHRAMERFVCRNCRGMYERRVLSKVCEWKDSVLLRWLAALLTPQKAGSGAWSQAADPASDGQGEDEGEAELRQWRLRHDFSVFEVFSRVRMGEMFDIIRDFPDSLPAVQELRDALAITQQHKTLACSLRESMRKRLLHKGANTMQIIDVYISTIKALRVVDPSDVLLEAVARPIRAYLRARKDTVRCIVTSLTDENSGDLHEELRRQEAGALEQGVDSDDEEGGPGEDWQPPSHDAYASLLSSRRRGDILSLLVSIYGSKELFVSEYRLMLADRLLTRRTHDTDREVQNLELLKLRFGEASLHHCEIMIRDVDDSKRVNTNVRSSLRRTAGEAGAAEGEEDIVDATIVSHHFWPPLQDDDLQLHPRVASLLKRFGDTYALLKNPRKLEFKQQLGTAQIDLDFDNGVRRSFTVSPVHATLILHFQDQEGWSLEELSRQCGLNSDVVGKRMMLWVNHGVVQVTADQEGQIHYQLIQDQHESEDASTASQGGGGSVGRSLEDDDLLVPAVSVDAQQAQALRVYKDYISSMLTTHGPRNLKQIYQTLRVWASDQQRYHELRMPELQDLLGTLCNQEDSNIEFVDGLYQLVAKQGN